MIWFTSDTHFGHSNIIKYCDRPFKNIQEMNEELILNINEVVEQDDHLYHLGDFCFSRDAYKIRQRINCRNVYLVKGNHDSYKLIKDVGFTWIKDVYELKAEGYNFWLSHFSHRRWPHSHKGSIHLYGHSHGDIEDYGRSTDVGVDAQDYYPVSIRTIVGMMEKRPYAANHANQAD